MKILPGVAVVTVVSAVAAVTVVAAVDIFAVVIAFVYFELIVELLVAVSLDFELNSKMAFYSLEKIKYLNCSVFVAYYYIYIYVRMYVCMYTVVRLLSLYLASIYEMNMYLTCDMPLYYRVSN